MAKNKRKSFNLRRYFNVPNFFNIMDLKQFKGKNRFTFVFESSISSPRLSSIAIVYPSSLAKGTSEILLFLHTGHICCSERLSLLPVSDL
jgi:hypothetical protein